MSDQINNQAASAGDNSNSGNILKELSDIKLSLGLNTQETSYIKENVNEVKAVVKEMQKNYITIQQHQEIVSITADHETRIRKGEAFQNNSLGKNTMLASIISVAVSIIIILISRYIK